MEDVVQFEGQQNEGENLVTFTDEQRKELIMEKLRRWALQSLNQPRSWDIEYL